MKIIGCDFHPSYQQFAMTDTESGERQEGRREHEQGEARRFYQALAGTPVRVVAVRDRRDGWWSDNLHRVIPREHESGLGKRLW